jgi:hypothetical protein
LSRVKFWDRLMLFCRIDNCLQIDQFAKVRWRLFYGIRFDELNVILNPVYVPLQLIVLWHSYVWAVVEFLILSDVLVQSTARVVTWVVVRMWHIRSRAWESGCNLVQSQDLFLTPVLFIFT